MVVAPMPYFSIWGRTLTVTTAWTIRGCLTDTDYFTDNPLRPSYMAIINEQVYWELLNAQK